MKKLIKFMRKCIKKEILSDKFVTRDFGKGLECSKNLCERKEIYLDPQGKKIVYINFMGCLSYHI